MLLALILSVLLCSVYVSSLPSASGVIIYELFISSDYATGTVTLVPEAESLLYISGTVVTITITPDPDGAYTRFIYAGVEGTGTGSYTGDATTFQVTMNDNIEEYILWRLQYLVDFETAGISGATGSAVIVTVNGAPKTADDLPFVDWYDSYSVITYTYNSPVSGIYLLSGMTESRVDASGHLITDTGTGSYTVSTYATISGLYTVTTTTSTTSTTSTATSVWDGGVTSTATSTTATSSTSSSGSSGGHFSLPDFGGFIHTLGSEAGSWFTSLTSGAWLEGSWLSSPFMGGSFYGVSNLIILIIVIVLVFIIGWLMLFPIIFAKRRKRGR